MIVDEYLLTGPGLMSEMATFPFVMQDVPMVNDTFNGDDVSLSYFLQVVMQNCGPVLDLDFRVCNVGNPHRWISEPITMRCHVGGAHVEAFFDRNLFRLDEELRGRLNFLLLDSVDEIRVELNREVTVLGNEGVYVKKLAEFLCDLKSDEVEIGGSLDVSMHNPEFDTTQELLNEFGVSFYLNLVVVTRKRVFVAEEEFTSLVKEPDEMDEMEMDDKLEDPNHVYFDSDSSFGFDEEVKLGVEDNFSYEGTTSAAMVRFYRAP